MNEKRIILKPTAKKAVIFKSMTKAVTEAISNDDELVELTTDSVDLTDEFDSIKKTAQISKDEQKMIEEIILQAEQAKQNEIFSEDETFEQRMADFKKFILIVDDLLAELSDEKIDKFIAGPNGDFYINIINKYK